MSKTFVFASTLVAIVLAVVPGPFAQTRQDNDKAAADAVKNRALPLVTTRTLSFTTSEGTWLSLDLSRDGRTLVFELLGDFYTLPITGGEATRITSGQAYDMQPSFSPDGKRIVFVSDRNGSENLWIANGDGTRPRAVTSTERENYMSPMRVVTKAPARFETERLILRKPTVADAAEVCSRAMRTTSRSAATWRAALAWPQRSRVRDAVSRLDRLRSARSVGSYLRHRSRAKSAGELA